MKFTLLTLLATAATTAYATVIDARAAAIADGWHSVERGITHENGQNVTLERRVGTEVVTCYGFGTKVDRAPATTVIDDWCNNYAIGKFVAKGATLWSRYDYGSFTILVSGTALNNPNCGGFTIDSNCNRLLRLPVDKCNTGGVNGKEGGYVTDLCGQWRFDPGSNGSDV